MTEDPKNSNYESFLYMDKILSTTTASHIEVLESESLFPECKAFVLKVKDFVKKRLSHARS